MYTTSVETKRAVTRTREEAYIDGADDAKYKEYLEIARRLRSYHQRLSLGRSLVSDIRMPDSMDATEEGGFYDKFRAYENQFISELNTKLSEYDALISDISAAAQKADQIASRYERSRHRTRIVTYTEYID